MKSRGLATVLIAIHGHRELLEHTLRSVLRQSYPDFQLLLVDDASPDDTLEILRKFTDPRIELLRLRKHRGQAGATNYALSKARGQWITILDSDDLMTPDSLWRRVEFLSGQGARAWAVMGRNRLIDIDDRPLPLTHPFQRYQNAAVRTLRQLQKTVGGILPELFVFGTCSVNSMGATLFTRQALETVGRFNEHLTACEDREYLLRLSWLKPISFLDVAVVDYRVHSANRSFRMKGNRLRSHPLTGQHAQQLETFYHHLRSRS